MTRTRTYTFAVGRGLAGGPRAQSWSGHRAIARSLRGVPLLTFALLPAPLLAQQQLEVKIEGLPLR
jgi:hypothetical protein